MKNVANVSGGAYNVLHVGKSSQTDGERPATCGTPHKAATLGSDAARGQTVVSARPGPFHHRRPQRAPAP
ncbi:hypothetical protein OJAV_G00060150 [Oryzias javanicus]|uniref:Uncharacterized protein n=1 Tax=Oryzias javanicus TaxID=123683 RepID=A0A3S2PPF7_ORYJA|nr:hypothetical protein OJAV_G00060150 [Oryzias javanicus]